MRRPKGPPHELVILTKSQKNWLKIVDFLFKAYFWAICQFWVRICTVKKRKYFKIAPTATVEFHISIMFAQLHSKIVFKNVCIETNTYDLMEFLMILKATLI